MGRKKSTEDEVKKHLLKIREMDGGWEAMLDILWRRRIVAWLKEGRLAQGLTQAQLAERMGVSQGRVAEIENELWPDPRMATLARYAHALGAELHVEAVPKATEPVEDAAGEPCTPPVEPKPCPVKDCPYTAGYCPGHEYAQ